MGVFGLAGYGLDERFGTWPKFFVGGLAISYPLTLITLIKKIKKSRP